MFILFVIAADVAVAATVLAVMARVVLHALLYLAVSLIAVAVVFYTLGAPFIAALEVIIYAGAIIVLFIFAVMLISPKSGDWEWHGRRRGGLVVSSLLALVLLVELIYIIAAGPGESISTRTVGPRQVGIALFGPYALGVELASMLLLVALIGARHLVGRPERAGGPNVQVTDASEEGLIGEEEAVKG